MDWLEGCDVLEGSTDEVYGNWFGFIVMDRDIDSGSTAIVKHPKRVDLTLRECRADSIINKNPPTFNTNTPNSTNNPRQFQTIQHLYVVFTRYTDSKQLIPRSWGIYAMEMFLEAPVPDFKGSCPITNETNPIQRRNSIVTGESMLIVGDDVGV